MSLQSEIYPAMFRAFDAWAAEEGVKLPDDWGEQEREIAAAFAQWFAEENANDRLGPLCPLDLDGY